MYENSQRKEEKLFMKCINSMWDKGVENKINTKKEKLKTQKKIAKKKNSFHWNNLENISERVLKMKINQIGKKCKAEWISLGKEKLAL